MHLRIHLRGPTSNDNHSIGLSYIQCMQKISCTSASRRKDCLCQVPVGKVDFSFVHSLRCWLGIHKLASISSSVILSFLSLATSEASSLHEPQATHSGDVA